MTDDKILNKIKGLLAKAESTTFDDERTAFMAKANELMVKYAIDQAQLATENRVSDEVKTNAVFNEGSYAYAESIGWSSLCKAFGTVRYYISGSALNKNHTGFVVGFTSDVEVIKTLHASLKLQSITAMRKHFKENGYRSFNGSDRYRDRRQFLISFWVAASAKVEETKKRVVEESTTGAELALIDRAAIVDRHMPSDLSDTTNRSHGGSRDAALAGGRAGRRADVGQTRVSGAKTAIGR